MSSNNTYTLDEILNLVEGESQVLGAKIYVCPPSNNYGSDEDSGEEQEVDINRLNRNQLLANAEASITFLNDCELITRHVFVKETQSTSQLHIENSNTTLGNISQANSVNVTYPNPTSSLPSTSTASIRTLSLSKPLSSTSTASIRQESFYKPSSKKQKITKDRTWEKKDLDQKPEKEWELPKWLQESEHSPVDFFEMFYDDDVINLICNYTNKYANDTMQPSGYTPADIRCFIAILLVSGYSQVPRVKMYWETKEDVWNKGIAEAMPRNKFLNIMRCFHVCDNNNLDMGTKFSKVLPLWKMLNERWVKFYAGDASLSVDESMIPYYGRHSAKQHIHGKPIRFGYKAWCLCTRFGYLVQASLYEGAATGYKYPEVGLGGSVVLNLSEILPTRKDGYSLYFDNFFTSVPLLEMLKEKGHYGTGTIRVNRIEKAPLLDVKIIQKKPRGSFEQLTESKSEITLVRYNDNNVVTVASTLCGIKPINKVRRWSSAEKKYINVDQPSCIALYNNYMGGVDRLDENISNLRVGIRGKKWYWQLLTFPINASMNNAWLLYRWTPSYNNKRLDLLGFTREITLSYLKKYSTRVNIGRPLQNVRAVEKLVTTTVRYDNEGHLVTKGDKQTRCGQCKKNTTMQCIKCRVALHSKCFVIFDAK